MDLRCPPEAEAYREKVHVFLGEHLPLYLVLGLPTEPRADAGPWNEQARA